MNTTAPTDKIAALVSQNPFMQVLAQMHGGLTVTEASDELAKLVAAVKKSGKKGSLKITLTVTPDGKGEVHSVETEAKVTVDAPKKNVRPTVFFVGEDNSLSREDPNQKEIEFERVSAPAGQAKAASSAK